MALLADEAAKEKALRCVRNNKMRIVLVTFLGTPLFAEPCGTSRKLAYLNKGTMLEVLGDEGDFLQVRMHNNAVGYVHRSSAVAV
jgi:hypothetical protein